MLAMQSAHCRALAYATHILARVGEATLLSLPHIQHILPKNPQQYQRASPREAYNSPIIERRLPRNTRSGKPLSRAIGHYRLTPFGMLRTCYGLMMAAPKGGLNFPACVLVAGIFRPRILRAGRLPPWIAGPAPLNSWPPRVSVCGGSSSLYPHVRHLASFPIALLA